MEGKRLNFALEDVFFGWFIIVAELSPAMACRDLNLSNMIRAAGPSAVGAAADGGRTGRNCGAVRRAPALLLQPV